MDTIGKCPTCNEIRSGRFCKICGTPLVTVDDETAPGTAELEICDLERTVTADLHCPKCSHDLTAATLKPNCPNCGQPLRW